MGKWTRRAFITTGVVAGGGLAVGVALRPGHRSVALVADERHWHYEIEWSPMPGASLPAREALIVLTVGNATLELTSDTHATGQRVALSDASSESARYLAIVFAASLHRGAARSSELRAVDTSLRMLQAMHQAELAVWLCTASTQPMRRPSAA